ncbi:MAG: TonB-dependent receptor [Alphaproteobacteria bacterium]|nr:TonB-dependent receptor [Alphaproteobacteria bacterium]
MSFANFGLCRPWMLAGAALACALPAAGLEPGPDPAATGVERITITADREGLFDVSGSVQRLDETELERHGYSDPNRVLRLTPGVYLQEEDGAGLRPNIGIRGSGSDRSSRITVMEDGVLMAPAPYSAPAAYYFPRLARMTGIELSKGPASIVYGPFTTGGALHLFGAPIPETDGRLSGGLDVRAGDFGGSRVHARAGGWRSAGPDLEVGGLLQALDERSDGFKELDTGRGTGFDIQDSVARLGVRTLGERGPVQSLELKVQSSTEVSDETYLGLTLEDFESQPFRRYRASDQDRMAVDHQTMQLTYEAELSPDLVLTAIAYETRTSRQWYKLQDVRNRTDTSWVTLSSVLASPTLFSEAYASLVGAPGYVASFSPAGELRVRNNLRSYRSAGVQGALDVSFATGPADHKLQISLRRHEDLEDRFQNDDRYQMSNSQMVLRSAGAPGSQDNRLSSADAWSAFVRDEVRWGDFIVSPGIRWESIESRQALYSLTDPSRSGAVSTVSNRLTKVIPGVGVTFAPSQSVRLFAGVHKGFSPPAPGSRADAETSWNYEVGARYQDDDVHAEAVVFANEFDNLVGTCTSSSGEGCTIGDQFSGGQASVRGLEIVAEADVGGLLRQSFSAPVGVIYTLTEGTFGSSFVSSYSPWGRVTSGDLMPQMPRHQVTLTAGLETDIASLHLLVNYVSDARSTVGRGDPVGTDLIDGRVLLDLSGRWEVFPGAFVTGSVTNLTDEIYNAGFRPAGARPGSPRQVSVGLSYSF